MALNSAFANLLEDAPRGMDPEEEIRLFRLLVEQRLLIAQLEAKTRRSRAENTALREARERHLAIRNLIIESNLPLAISAARRSRARNVDPEELASIMLEKLVDVVDHFDPERGFKFSTFACTAMHRAANRAGQVEARKWGGSSEPTENDLAREPDDSEDLRDKVAVAMAAAELSDLEAFVVRMRFGLGEAEPKSLEELGLIIGLGRERIRQILVVSMGKLRTVLT